MDKSAHYTFDFASHQLCPTLSPRQFEYHPYQDDRLVLGTSNGEVAVVNHETGGILGASRLGYASKFNEAPCRAAEARSGGPGARER